MAEGSYSKAPNMMSDYCGQQGESNFSNGGDLSLEELNKAGGEHQNKT